MSPAASVVEAPSFGRRTDQVRKLSAALGMPTGAVVVQSRILPKTAVKGAVVVGPWRLATAMHALTSPGMTHGDGTAMLW